MAINRRVEAIRHKSKEERSKVAALGEQVVDPDARRLLTDRATKLLDDVDQFFLSTEIRAVQNGQQILAVQMAIWPDCDPYHTAVT